MKKAKSTKAIDIKTMQPVTLKPAKAAKKAKEKPKPNFSTEKFVNVEDGQPLKKPIASLHIEVYQTGKDEVGLSVKGAGSRNHIREAIVKTMRESESYFDLFMECAALAMVDKAEEMAKTSAKKSSKKSVKAKPAKAVSKKPATKKK